MNKRFVKLPTGIIINIERITFIGRVNAIKAPRARKPHEWDIKLQFINEDRPTIFEYTDEEEARNDYQALVAACEKKKI